MFTDDTHSIKPSILKVSRIGRKITGRIRPIKVSFASPSEAMEILRRKIIFKNESFNLSLDKTKKQRQIYNEVRKQLIARRNNGEVDLIIKHIKGNPTIISKN